MIVSPGSVYTESETGRQVEVLATTPRVLYSPVGTYDTDFADSRIFQIDLEDFLNFFIDLDFGIPLGFIVLTDSDGAFLTDDSGSPILYEVS